MMKKNTCATVLAGLLVFNGAAIAGEKTDRLLPTSGVDWNGLYAGGSIGYGWGEARQSYDRAGNHGKARLKPDGAAAAAHVGYNWMFSRTAVFGLEADIGVMNISKGATTVFDGHVWSTTTGPFWSTVRGRAGVAAGRLMFYGTGGLALASFDDTSIGNTPGETAIEKGVRAGWVVGAGLEYAINEAWSARIEYLHMDFGKTSGTSSNNEDYSFENEVDLIRIGASYRF